MKVMIEYAGRRISMVDDLPDTEEHFWEVMCRAIESLPLIKLEDLE